MKMEIMDTTLRDGEQTSGVSFAPHEKLGITQMLLETLGVDRVEIGSARVSEGEKAAVRRVIEWAKDKGYEDRVEVLGFVDGGSSLEWIESVGGKVMNLLTKGSRRHVENQLRKSVEEHLRDVRETVLAAHARNIRVNLYLEDWSNGMIHSRDYVYQFMDALADLPVKRVMLPDTLGILNPSQTAEFCSEMLKRYPHFHFDFHAHNDYDLALANVFAAAQAGIRGIHTTVNGLGERAGNVG